MASPILPKMTTGYHNWPLLRETRHFLDVFPKERVVYLSSESEDVLDQLDEDPGLTPMPTERH